MLVYTEDKLFPPSKKWDHVQNILCWLPKILHWWGWTLFWHSSPRTSKGSEGNGTETIHAGFWQIFKPYTRASCKSSVANYIKHVKTGNTNILGKVLWSFIAKKIHVYKTTLATLSGSPLTYGMTARPLDKLSNIFINLTTPRPQWQLQAATKGRCWMEKAASLKKLLAQQWNVTKIVSNIFNFHWFDKMNYDQFISKKQPFEYAKKEYRPLTRRGNLFNCFVYAVVINSFFVPPSTAASSSNKMTIMSGLGCQFDEVARAVVEQVFKWIWNRLKKITNKPTNKNNKNNNKTKSEKKLWPMPKTGKGRDNMPYIWRKIRATRRWGG